MLPYQFQVYNFFSEETQILPREFLRNTVEPPLTATTPHRPGFFVPIIRLSILFTLIETSLQRPPLYNGQLIPPQGGRCREVQLYKEQQ